MLHVLWVILKIILIILAVVLGLVLLIVLLVLFAPIRYKVAADIGDDIAVTAKVRFLIVSVNVIFEKNEKKLDTFLRIVGIKISLGDKSGEGHKKKESKPKKEKKKNKSDESMGTSDISDTSEKDKSLEEAESIEKSESIEKTKAIEQSETVESDDSEDNLSEYDLWTDEDTLNEDEKKLSGRIKRLLKKSKKTVKDLDGKSEEEIKETLYQKLEKKVNQLKDKKEELEKKVNRFKKFWDMKCTVRTREYLGKYLISILKHIAPKKIKGHMRYGFDEPCTTGQVTGYLSLLPFVYQKGFSLEPDFREKVIEGNVVLKGRIILGYIARIVLKRYIWQTIKMARKI